MFTNTTVSSHFYILYFLFCLIFFLSAADVYAKMTYMSDGDIYVCNDNLSAKRNLTKNSGFSDSQPRWSPDGSHIVFTRIMDRSKSQTSDEIFVMNADGTDQQRLTNNNVSDREPCWSPDGKHIAFTSRISGISQIFVMELSTSALTQLTGIDEDENERGSFAPDWSPDGTEIIYEKFIRSPFGFSHKTIYVMDSDGENQQPLLSDLDENNDEVIMRFRPRWSADGRMVLYDDATWLDATGQTGKLTIMQIGHRHWTVDGIYDILNDKHGENVLIGGHCWMNKDRELLFGLRLIDKSRKNYDLYKFDLISGRLTRLTRSPEVVEGYPDWIEGTLSVDPAKKKVNGGGI